MNREEVYCDICGKQLTYLDADGDQQWQGIRLSFGDINATCQIKRDYGSSSKLESLSWKDFCSFRCFEHTAVSWIHRVKGASE